MEDYTRQFYDEDGNVVSQNDKALAKSLHYSDGRVKYFIKFYDGALLDSINFNVKSRRMVREAAFKKVGPLCFQLYMKFLKTKSVASLNQAQRHTQE